MAKAPLAASQLLAAHAIRNGDEELAAALKDVKLPSTLGAAPVIPADSSPATVRAVLEAPGWRALVPLAKVAERSDTRVELLRCRFASVHAAVLENPAVTPAEVEEFLLAHQPSSLGKTAAALATDLVMKYHLDHLIPRLPQSSVLAAVPAPIYNTHTQLWLDVEPVPLGASMPELNRVLLDAFASSDPAEVGSKGWWTRSRTPLSDAHLFHVVGLPSTWAAEAAESVKAVISEKRKRESFVPAFPTYALQLLRHRSDLPDRAWAEELAYLISEGRLSQSYDVGFFLSFGEYAGRGTSTSLNRPVVEVLAEHADRDRWPTSTRSTVRVLLHLLDTTEPYILPDTHTRPSTTVVELCRRGVRFDPDFLMSELSTVSTGYYLTAGLVGRLVEEYGASFEALYDVVMLSRPSDYAASHPERYLRAFLSPAGASYNLSYVAAQHLAAWLAENRAAAADILASAPVPDVLGRLCVYLPPAEEIYAELLATAASETDPALFTALVDSWTGTLAELRTVASA